MAGVGIGLDIGTSALKLAELQGGKEIRVNRLEMVPLAGGLVSAGEVKDPVEVGEAIKSLIELHNIQSKRVVIAVAGQAAVVRLLKITVHNKKELADIVMKEAEKNLPYALDELYMDFQVIREDMALKEAEVVLACARKIIIDSQLEAVRSAGLEPVAVDIQPFALVRAAGFENIETFGNIGLLDIGEETSDLIIIKDGIPVFTRIIPLAGNRITQLIAESIGIPYGSADELKRVYGDVNRDLTQLSPDDIDYKVNSMVQKGVKELTAELKRSFEYFYLQQQDDTAITTLVVSGGGSKMKNLLLYLGQELDIRVITCPQPENVVCSPENLLEFNESWPVYNVALGLALRAMTEAPRINLLPEGRLAKRFNPAGRKPAPIKPHKSRIPKNQARNIQVPEDIPVNGRRQNSVLIYICWGIFLLGSLLFLLGEYSVYDPAVGELESLEEQLVQYRADLDREQQTQKPESASEYLSPELAPLTHMYRPWPVIIQGLSSALPEEAWLTGITGSNMGSIIVNARSLTVAAAQDFIQKLQNNTFFYNIRLISMKQVTPGIPDYIFTLEIETGGAVDEFSEK